MYNIKEQVRFLYRDLVKYNWKLYLVNGVKTYCSGLYEYDVSRGTLAWTYGVYKERE